MKNFDKMAEEYADRVKLNPNTYRGDIVTAYVCGCICGCIDSLSSVDKGEAMTAEEIVNGIAEFGEKIDDILEDYFHKKIDLLEVRKQLLGLYSSALRKVETSILMPMSAREWFAKETNRKVEEFDDYDLHVCRVAEGYARTVKVEMPSEDKIENRAKELYDIGMDLEDESPISYTHKQVCLREAQCLRAGARWAIEQIKHLNKL